jgi:predicted amidophosphoribosyltransferase
MLAREGVAPVACQLDPASDEPPCPACGTAAPLVAGACSDCGLQLE